jgi:hypothetical protein
MVIFCFCFCNSVGMKLFENEACKFREIKFGNADFNLFSLVQK